MKRSEISFSLPRGVRPKHGAFYLVEPLKLDGKWLYRWHRLCKISDGEAALYTALGIAKAPRQVWISRRIPERRIDAVDDARE
jgi:hypothetical protein